MIVLSNLNGVGAHEVNAFQRRADVVLQKSTREGFGLTVSEGLWKFRPVVAGNVGGIPLQVIDGQTGFLVSDVHTCAEKTFYLLQHPPVAEAFGRRGHEHVKAHFLSTRLVRDYLQLLNDLKGAQRAAA